MSENSLSFVLGFFIFEIDALMLFFLLKAAFMEGNEKETTEEQRPKIGKFCLTSVAFLKIFFLFFSVFLCFQKLMLHPLFFVAGSLLALLVFSGLLLIISRRAAFES